MESTTVEQYTASDMGYSSVKTSQVYLDAQNEMSNQLQTDHTEQIESQTHEQLNNEYSAQDNPKDTGLYQNQDQPSNESHDTQEHDSDDLLKHQEYLLSSSNNIYIVLMHICFNSSNNN